MSRHEGDTSQPLLLTEKAVAKLLGFSRRTLQGWRSEGGPGLPFVRISKGCVRYRRSDIEAWLQKQARTSTADDAARGTVLRKPREDREDDGPGVTSSRAPRIVTNEREGRAARTASCRLPSFDDAS